MNKTKELYLKRKKLEILSLLLSGTILMSGCVKKEDSNESIGFSRPKYTIVNIVNGNAILYDTTSLSYSRAGIIDFIQINEEMTTVDIRNVMVFQNHESAEKYALAAVGETGNIICMDYPEHDVKTKKLNK